MCINAFHHCFLCMRTCVCVVVGIFIHSVCALISVPCHVCSRGGDDTLASEQLDSAGFSVFMNRVNNYPGVAANSGDGASSAWLQTSANEEKKNNCQTPHQIPCSLFCCAVSLSLCSPHSLISLFFCSSVSPLCESLALPSSLSKAFALPPPHFSPFLFLSFRACLFLDHRNTRAENKLDCEWKWLNKIGSIKTFHLWVKLW